jgi:hypothetical protein
MLMDDNRDRNNSGCEMLSNNHVTLSDMHMIDMETNISISSPIKNKNKSLYYIFSEKVLTILTHVLIMISFEIYFYFNYVIIIERKLFLEKINSYFDQINKNYDDTDNVYKESISYLITNYDSEYLHEQYEDAISEQNKNLYHLLKISLFMLCIILVLFLCALINALIYMKYIHWLNIFIENVCMFILLGIFEYLFFNYVILQYTPISDEELQYIMYNNMYNIVNNTYS